MKVNLINIFFLKKVLVFEHNEYCYSLSVRGSPYLKIPTYSQSHCHTADKIGCTIDSTFGDNDANVLRNTNNISEAPQVPLLKMLYLLEVLYLGHNCDNIHLQRHRLCVHLCNANS